MGTKTRVAMHSIAYDQALKKGPTTVIIDRRRIAAYSLTKLELAKLFEVNGWSSDRISWLKAIRAWRDYFDDVAPKDQILFEKDAQWSVIFNVTGLNETKTLEYYANRNDLELLHEPCLPDCPIDVSMVAGSGMA